MSDTNLPKTPEEALAQGYLPIPDIQQYLRDRLPPARRHEFDAFVAPGVNCADPANLGKVCRRIDDLNIICFCGPNKICNCYGK